MSMSPSEKFGDSRDELMKTCMECWRLAGYCQPAPTMMWYENCEHLLAIGDEIREKLKNREMASLRDIKRKRID